MRELIIENFNKGTYLSVDARLNTPELFHRSFTSLPVKNFISSNPDYDLTYQRSDCLYPIYPSLKFVKAEYGPLGNIVSFTKYGRGNGFVCVTSMGHILNIHQNNLVINFGQTNTIPGAVAHFGDKIVVFNGNNHFFHKNDDNTGSWGAVSNVGTDPTLATVFANWIYVLVKTNNFYTTIKMYNSSFVEQTPSFNVESRANIIDVKNINEENIAVIVLDRFNKTTLRIWDAMPGTSFIKSLSIRGTYHGMVNVGDTWFLVSSSRGNIYIYEYGNSLLFLKEFFVLDYIVSSVIALDYYLILALRKESTTSSGPNEAYLFFYNTLTKENFLTTIGASSDFHGGLFFDDNILYSFKRYTGPGQQIITASYYVDLSKGQINLNNLGPMTTDDFYRSNHGFYKSNWINFERSVLIDSIEVFYDGKLDFTNSIVLDLELKNEYERSSYEKINLGEVKAFDPPHRKFFKVNKKCSKFRIDLLLKYNGGNWLPAVKKIKINYNILGNVQ